jgi:hypothetical protein
MARFGSPRHVLYIGPRGLIALREARGEFVETGRFEASASAADAAETSQAQAFADWLRGWPNDRFELIVDAIDEEQHADRLPKVKGRDHRMLIARRIEQRYRDAEFTLATLLVPTASSREARRAIAAETTVQVLLSAIRSPASLAPWLAVLRTAETPIVSLHTPALLAAAVANRIAPHESGLLVSLHPGGLRQTLVLGGHLRFSRLAASIDGRRPEAVSAELRRSIQYLMMSQTLPQELVREGRLKIWIVLDGLAEPTRLPAALVLDQGGSVAVETHTMASLGAPRLSDAGDGRRTSDALALWLNPKLRGKLRLGYANASMRRFELIGLWRRALWGMGAGAVTVAALASAWVELGRLPADRDLRQGTEITSRNDAEWKRLEAEIASHPLSGAEMEAVVESARALERRQIDAAQLLTALATAMPEDVELKLSEIAWSRAASAVLGGGGAGGDGSMPPSAAIGMPAPGQAVPPPGAELTALPPLGSGPTAGTLTPSAGGAAGLQIPPIEGVLRGTVEGTLGKTDANALVERYAEGIRRQCACEVEVRQWPYERGPGGTWSKDFDKEDLERPVPFSLTLRWPEPSDERAIARRQDASRG